MQNCITMNIPQNRIKWVSYRNHFFCFVCSVVPNHKFTYVLVAMPLLFIILFGFFSEQTKKKHPMQQNAENTHSYFRCNSILCFFFSPSLYLYLSLSMFFIFQIFALLLNSISIAVGVRICVHQNEFCIWRVSVSIYRSTTSISNIEMCVQCVNSIGLENLFWKCLM